MGGAADWVYSKSQSNSPMWQGVFGPFQSLADIAAGPPKPPDFGKIMAQIISPEQAIKGTQQPKLKGAVDWIFAGRNPWTKPLSTDPKRAWLAPPAPPQAGTLSWALEQVYGGKEPEPVYYGGKEPK